MNTVALGPGVEFDRIRGFLRGAGGDDCPGGVHLGPGDDAAWVDGLVLSVDLTVEDVHFRRSWLSLREVGYRAVAAAGSDLAAMAAEPVGVLLSAALPSGLKEEELEELRLGVHEGCEVLGGALLGGDLSSSPGPLVLDVAVVGRADEPVLRTGARPGDEIWVTGRLGGSAGALDLLQRGKDPPPALREAFARPRPRVREALWLRSLGCLRALIDLSDGLAGDAGHLAAAGGVSVVLVEGDLPLHRGLTKVLGLPMEEAVGMALGGGEDYELCFVTPPEAVGPEDIERFRQRFSLPLTRVGWVERGEGVRTLRSGATEPRPWRGGGYDHFTGARGERR